MKRREFLSDITLKTGGLLMTTSLLGCTISSKPNQKKLGVALVGLGGYATGQLAPALQQTSFCELRGIVTGTPSKVDTWVDKYKIPDSNVYNYDTFDEIASNDDIDIIYVVLPNSMHAEYTIRAAQAGKHVICEKPMATNYDDCVKMIDACKKAGKKLSIGYRLHFEPYNLEVMRLGQQKVYGEVQSIESGFAFNNRNKDAWRLQKEMSGGGPLMDVGVYAVQATIYSLGALPKSLKATDTTVDKSFYDTVEGSLEADLIFDSNVSARIKTSYEEGYNYTRATAESGSWEISPAYSYGGLKGKTHLGSMDFPNINQQAAQMDAFAKCILEDKKSIVSGEMGARDMFIIDRIYESAAAGKEISLQGIPKILHLV